MSAKTNSSIRKISLWDVTLQAWKDMVRILFKPLRWRVWWRLCVLALFAGSLTGGIDLGFQKDIDIPRPDFFSSKTQPADSYKAVATPPPSSGTLQQSKADSAVSSRPLTYYDILDAKDRVQMLLRTYGKWLYFIGFGVLILWILFLWVNSRCVLMFVDALLRRRIKLVQSFERVRSEANQLFVFQVMISGLMFIFMSTVGWVLYKNFDATYSQVPELPISDFLAQHTPGLLYSLFAFVSLSILMGLLGVLFYIWFVDFVVPILYHARKGVGHAWLTSLSFVRQHFLESLKYLGWRCLLSVVASACSSALLLVVSICVGLATVAVFGLGWLLLLIMPWLNGIFMFLGFMVFLVALTVEVVLVLLSSLPPAVMLRFFSLRYLTSLDWDYHFFGARKVRR